MGKPGEELPELPAMRELRLGLTMGSSRMAVQDAPSNQLEITSLPAVPESAVVPATSDAGTKSRLPSRSSSAPSLRRASFSSVSSSKGGALVDLATAARARALPAPSQEYTRERNNLW